MASPTGDVPPSPPDNPPPADPPPADNPPPADPPPADNPPPPADNPPPPADNPPPPADNPPPPADNPPPPADNPPPPVVDTPPPAPPPVTPPPAPPPVTPPPEPTLSTVPPPSPTPPPVTPPPSPTPPPVTPPPSPTPPPVTPPPGPTPSHVEPVPPPSPTPPPVVETDPPVPPPTSGGGPPPVVEPPIPPPTSGGGPPPVVEPPLPPPTSGGPPPPPPPVRPSPAPPPPLISPPPPVRPSPPPSPLISPPPPVVSPPPPGVSPSPPLIGGPPPVVSPPPPGVSPPPIRLAPPPLKAQSPTSVVLAPPTNSTTPSTPTTVIIAGVAGGGGLVAFIVIFGIVCFWRSKKNKRKDVLPYTSAGSGGSGYGGAGAAAYKAGGMGDPKGYAGIGGTAKAMPGGIPLPPEGNPSAGNSRSMFSYEELHKATNGFADENLLGEGGFGRVYKGVLSTGQVVAVKQLTLGSVQGDREFQAEVDIIRRVHHRHLVSLVGFCIADKQRLLVYDFVPNGTLDVNLYGRGKPVMTWEMRVRVALGAARGLAYLHEDCHPRIIHRDIKSSNILLDDKYEAQVADFGLAKLASDTNTHVSTRVMGTFGYLAPEYAQSGKLTEKSDVFSFGVVLLELITGRKPVVGEVSLVELTRPLINHALDDGNVEELMDPQLDGDYDAHEALKILEVAASCVRHTASRRPKMGQVVRALESEDINNIHQGLRPGQSSEHESDFDRYVGDYDTGAYNADMMRSKRSSARNRPYGSSGEYSSEYSSGPRTGGRSNTGLGGGGGSSSEFEPIIPKSSESTRTREPGPVSVRTGRSSMPKSRPMSTENYTSLPPVRAAPPRPDLISDRSGSMESDMWNPPANFSAEYSPIDFGAAKNLREGR